MIVEEAPAVAVEAPPAASAVSAASAGAASGEVAVVDAASAGTASAGAPGMSANQVPALGLATAGPLPWPLSAPDAEALCAQAECQLHFFDDHPEADLAGVAVALASRAAFTRRAVVIGARPEELREGLAALAEAGSAPGVIEGIARTRQPVVFVFPGQGAQWEGMAVELLDSSPLFAARMRACEEALAEHVEWSLEGVLRGAPGQPTLERVDVVQPALWAVMVSLAALWRACGVEPDAVVGHSQGEIAAAHVAGGLSLRDAARLAALRSRALVALAGRGGMASVALGEPHLRARLDELTGELPGEISIAAVNSPGATVVSGDPGALDELVAGCERDGVRARRIPVDYAAHAAPVEQLREELLAACAEIEPRPNEVPFCSSVTGGLLDTAMLDAEYWYRNLRETVRFEQATRALFNEGAAFVELSPHPVLTLAVQETAAAARAERPGSRSRAERPGRDAGGQDGGQDGTDEELCVVGSLRREEGGPDRFLRSLAEAWAQGLPVDWRRLLAESAARRAALPPYAFKRERFWLQSRRGPGDAVAAGQAQVEHPLLGAAVPHAAGEGLLFTGRLSLREQPWLADHAVGATVLLPGTAFVELALHAGAQLGCELLGELTIEAPLVLGEESATQLQVVVGPADDSISPTHRAVSIHSRPEDALASGLTESEQGWVRNASGVLLAGEQQSSADASLSARAGELGAAWPPAGADAVDVEEVYERLAARGLEYGPVFRGLQRLWRRGDELFAEVALPDHRGLDTEGFDLHPALLDAALHAGEVGLAGEGDGTWLPFAWKTSGCTQPGQKRCASSLRSMTAGSPCWPPTSWDAGRHRRLAGDARSLARPAERRPRHHPRLAVRAALGARGGARRGHGAPPFELLDCTQPSAGESLADVVQAETQRVLAHVQGWLTDEQNAETRLVVVTRKAVAVDEGEELEGLGGAALWGLVRSAQSEHPGRLVLADVDGMDASWGALEARSPTPSGHSWACAAARCANRG